MKTTQYILLAVLALQAIACTTEQPTTEANPTTETKPTKPLNVILLIGDGMGLSQASSLFYYGKDTVNLTRMEHIGLMNTSSASSKVTDSAAGATAFACGQKTYNGAIGMDTDSLPIANITEWLAQKQYKNGLVATSQITHATPAAYFAHQRSRHDEEEIAAQLHMAHIDFFAGGGLQFFNKREDQHNYLDTLAKAGFSVDTTQLPEKLGAEEKYGFLLAAKGMPTMLENRGDFLPKATQLAMDHLSAAETGFFLMVEGSQIDWAGHKSNAEYLIAETNDFDNAVGKALDFAEKDGNTLVVVLADHETGGFTLSARKGDYAQDEHPLQPTFATTSHSTTLIPVYAYGPHAELFTGFYQNNDIYHKLIQAFQK